MVEAELATRKLAELHGLLGPRFGRVEPFQQARRGGAGVIESALAGRGPDRAGRDVAWRSHLSPSATPRE